MERTPEEKVVEILAALRSRQCHSECSAAIDIAIRAVEKEIPKDPFQKKDMFLCPCCHVSVLERMHGRGSVHRARCGCCGQKIDWAEVFLLEGR